MDGDKKFLHMVWWNWTARINNDNGNVVVILDEYHSETAVKNARRDTRYTFPALTKDDIIRVLNSYKCDGIYGQPYREARIAKEFYSTIEQVRKELEPERENASVFVGSCPEFAYHYASTFQHLAEQFAVLQACRNAGGYNNFYGGGRDGKGYNLREEIMRHRLDGPTEETFDYDY